MSRVIWLIIGFICGIIWVSGNNPKPLVTQKPAIVKEKKQIDYPGIYMTLSETGDWCEKVIITLNDTTENFDVYYSAWYCGEPGNEPEPQKLHQVRIMKFLISGILPDGKKVSFYLNTFEKLSRKI